VIDSHVRERMQAVLDDIRSGEFAKLWIAEMDSGEAGLRGHRAEAANQLIEQVGTRLRALNVKEETASV
jgi:ketol-acid reductoisomerase